MSATIHSLGPVRAPSLDPMIQLVSADLNHVNASSSSGCRARSP